MNLKNISKLYVLPFVFGNCICGGCISHQTVVDECETEIKQSDGTIETVMCSNPHTEKQFTLLGRVYNGITYAAFGCGYMAYANCYDGITSTNNIPIIGPVANGLWGFTSGTVKGLYEGSIYGATMKYGQSPTLDDLIGDLVETSVLRTKRLTENCIGR